MEAPRRPLWRRSNMTVKRVAFVDRPANGQPFLMIKREGSYDMGKIAEQPDGSLAPVEKAEGADGTAAVTSGPVDRAHAAGEGLLKAADLAKAASEVTPEMAGILKRALEDLGLVAEAASKDESGTVLVKNAEAERGAEAGILASAGRHLDTLLGELAKRCVTADKLIPVLRQAEIGAVQAIVGRMVKAVEPAEAAVAPPLDSAKPQGDPDPLSKRFDEMDQAIEDLKKRLEKAESVGIPKALGADGGRPLSKATEKKPEGWGGFWL